MRQLPFGMDAPDEGDDLPSPFKPSKRPRSGLYVFSDGPSGPTSVSMKSAKDILPFVEHLLSIGRRNVRVGSGEQIAVPYEEWKANVTLPGKAIDPN